MGKVVAVVSSDAYKQIANGKSGFEITTFIHAHGKLNGTIDVIAAGKKPLSCWIKPANSSRNARRGSKKSRIEVVLTKK